jgi:hypothetical protein
MAFAYGLYNFGDGYYSETKYVDAVASGSASSSLSADSERIHLASSDVTATGSVSSAGLRIHQSGTQNPLPGSTATASANYLCNASALVEAQNAVTTDGVRVQFSLGSITTASTIVSSAERIQISAANDINAYSVNAPVGVIVTAGGAADIAMTSGSSASGEVIYLASVADSATASTSSAGLIVKDASAEPGATSSVTSACERARYGVAEIDATGSIDASANITAIGVSEIDGQSSVTSTCERIHLAEGVVSSTSVIITIGREKWEPIGTITNSWAAESQASTIWNNVA